MRRVELAVQSQCEPQSRQGGAPAATCDLGVCCHRYVNNGVGYQQSLVDMKVGSLRYPGGEKSDMRALPAQVKIKVVLGKTKP